MPARIFLVILSSLSIPAAVAQSGLEKKPVPVTADTAKQKINTTHKLVSHGEKQASFQPDSVLLPAGTAIALKSDGNEVSMESMDRRKPASDSVKTKKLPVPQAPQNKNEVSIETLEYRKQPVSPARKKQKSHHP